LQSKKLFILSKAKNLKIKVLDTILQRNDIYEDLVLNITYHTNNIEGSTLTKGETQDILFDHTMKVNKSIKEILEAKNHQIAFDYLLEYLSTKQKINETFVLELHSILMNGILPNAGQYRNHAVRIVGSNVPAANYLSIQKLMDQLYKNINRKTDDIVSLISKTHAEFERIHPFSDGNGRIGRLLIIGQLLSHNLPPAIIKKESKHNYYSYLAKAQNKEDYSSLESFICDAIIIGFEMLV
jgi:Fic family protein